VSSGEAMGRAHHLMSAGAPGPARSGSATGRLSDYHCSVRAKVSGQMSDEVASHLTGIIESMRGFLAAMMDLEMGRHAADPAASNFIAGNLPEPAMPKY